MHGYNQGHVCSLCENSVGHSLLTLTHQRVNSIPNSQVWDSADFLHHGPVLNLCFEIQHLWLLGLLAVHVLQKDSNFLYSVPDTDEIRFVLWSIIHLILFVCKCKNATWSCQQDLGQQIQELSENLWRHIFTALTWCMISDCWGQSTERVNFPFKGALLQVSPTGGVILRIKDLAHSLSTPITLKSKALNYSLPQKIKTQHQTTVLGRAVAKTQPL